MRTLLILTIGLVAACGGGTATNTSTGPAATSSGAAATASPAAATPNQPASTLDLRPPDAIASDPCALLTDAEIEAATGRTVDTKREGPVMGIFQNGCSWELGLGDEDTVPVSIEVGAVSPGGRDFYERYLKMGATGDVAGIADEATTTEAGGIDAVKGDTLLSFFVIAFGDEEDQITHDIAVAAFEKVP